MTAGVNGWLLAGGLASGIAAMAHLLRITGGPTWYRAMGAGERMTSAVARGDVRPHLVTLERFLTSLNREGFLFTRLF